MKRIRFTAISVALLFLCASLSAQNYYSGQTHVGENGRFEVSIRTYPNGKGWMWLKPVSPSVFDKDPYDIKTGKIYSVAYNPIPRIYLRHGIMKEIAAKIFTPSEIARYEDCPYWISMFMAVRPSDGRVIECQYYINFGEGKELLSIPPEKIEAIDKEIKASVVVDIPSHAKDASYLVTNAAMFDKAASTMNTPY